MDDNFTMTHSFYNLGDRVIGLDFFFKITKCVKDNNTTNLLDINKKKNKDENSETETKKIYYNNNMINSEENLNSSINDKNNIISNSENVKANANINIILLDIDGNINYYNDKEIITLFNINKIPEIDKSIREKGLFSLNYPYLIKYYHPFMVVSTDNGCYVFQLLNI